MDQERTQHDDSLVLLEGMEAFREQALAALRSGQRKVYLLSETLDPAVYDTDEFRDALRDLVIRDRYCKAFILVKDIQPIVERGHRLLELSRRLSSKVSMRKLTVMPRNKDEGYLVAGRSTLLYKHDDHHYKGYLDTAAAPRCRSLVEEFTQLWDLYGEEHPSLRQQLI